MLRDPLLQQRYAAYLERLLRLGEQEQRRLGGDDPTFRALADFYVARFQRLRAVYESLGGDLLHGFAALQDSGSLEIITVAATQATPYLDALDPAADADDWYRFTLPPTGAAATALSNLIATLSGLTSNADLELWKMSGSGTAATWGNTFCHSEKSLVYLSSMAWALVPASSTMELSMPCQWRMFLGQP